MARTLTVCAVFLTSSLSLSAQDPTVTTVKLTVSPAAAPKPALRYQLLPELSEMSPGNPIQGYIKCFMEQNHFFFNKDSVADREKWQTMPLKDLPAFQLRTYGGAALRRADDAARMDTPDWQILLELKRDGINTLLPEVQQLRTLSSALRVRFRGEIAEQRYNEALRTARTMLSMSRHLGEHPTLIANLVGMSIAGQTLSAIDEMLEQPDCPNLYWALTNLPNPLLSFHRGAQGERFLLLNELLVLDDKASMSETQVGKAIEQARKLHDLSGPGKGKPVEDIGTWIKKRSDSAEYTDKARQRLVEYGLDKIAVKDFPAAQVVLLDERREFEIRRDDDLKWMNFPVWEAEAAFAKNPVVKDGEELLYGILLAAVPKVRRAQGRVEQRIALMRIVEAVRLHAAANQGKLPEKLAELEVPVPVDPFTGKAFEYKLEGKTAVLRGSPPKNEEQNASYNVRYEVTIRP